MSDIGFGFDRSVPRILVLHEGFTIGRRRALGACWTVIISYLFVRLLQDRSQLTGRQQRDLMSASLGRGLLCLPQSRRPAAPASPPGRSPERAGVEDNDRAHRQLVVLRAATTQAPPKSSSEGHTALLHGLGSVGDIAPSHMPWLLRLAHTR